MHFSDPAGSGELRPHWTRGNTGALVFGVAVLCATGAAAGWGDALGTGFGVGATVFGVLLGVLSVLAATAPLYGPTARVRVDAVGVSLARGRTRRNPRYEVIGWGDIEAFVAWKNKGGYWVGVVASEAYRAAPGRTRPMPPADRLIGLPVSGTITAWDGPESELHAVQRAVAAFAPQIPCIDPTDR